MKLHEKIFEEVAKIIDPVFLVGGSTRDVIMGRDPKDYDFCTPLLPDDIEAKIKEAGRKVFGVGKKFGTLGFKVNVDGEWHMVEVTTFRTEVYEPGNRKPVVEYVSDLTEDLSRRDFTMNAIAFDGNELIDPFEGASAIQWESIEAVGDAEDRFREDPLRMLRAARFASVLGFMPSIEIRNAALKQAETILNVSKERWVQELDKLLMGKHAELMGLAFLSDTDVWSFMLPEVDARFSRNIDPVTVDASWASLFSRIGHQSFTADSDRHVALRSHEMAIGICHRLKFSTARTKFILDSLKAGVVQ